MVYLFIKRVFKLSFYLNIYMYTLYMYTCIWHKKYFNNMIKKKYFNNFNFDSCMDDIVRYFYNLFIVNLNINWYENLIEYYMQVKGLIEKYFVLLFLLNLLALNYLFPILYKKIVFFFYFFNYSNKFGKIVLKYLAIKKIVWMLRVVLQQYYMIFINYYEKYKAIAYKILLFIRYLPLICYYMTIIHYRIMRVKLYKAYKLKLKLVSKLVLKFLLKFFERRRYILILKKIFYFFKKIKKFIIRIYIYIKKIICKYINIIKFYISCIYIVMLYLNIKNDVYFSLYFFLMKNLEVIIFFLIKNLKKKGFF